MYGCEAWTMTSTKKRKLRTFEIKFEENTVEQYQIQAHHIIERDITENCYRNDN